MFEKTKAFFDSLTLDELTEQLKSIGIEFVKIGGNMKFNLEKIIGNRIHCNTEEKANALLKFLHENGFRWVGETPLTQYNNYWDSYEEKTCYEVNKDRTVAFADTNFFKNYIEFEDILEEEGGNKMYYNLVFIGHEGTAKNYLFKLPLNINLKAGEKVYVNTSRGQDMGVCASNNFIVDEHTTEQIIVGSGAYKPLKEVIGYAQEQTGYRCIEFDLLSVPF